MQIIHQARSSNEDNLKIISEIIEKIESLAVNSDLFEEISDVLRNNITELSKINIKELERLLKNISLQDFSVPDNNNIIFQETVFYRPNIDFSDKFLSFIEVCSKFPNIKKFRYEDSLNFFYNYINVGEAESQDMEIKTFISNPRFSSITQHNVYGPNRFFLTIDNGRILTSPQKEFSEFYPIIVKEIFEKTGILDSQALQSYIPSFDDQNQAEKFLILLYKLARANDLLTLTEAQKKQITSFFSNIKSLEPQEISKLDEIISKEEFSLNQLEQFYKEKSIKDQIFGFIHSSSAQQDQYLGSAIDQNSNLTKFLKVYQLFVNNNLETNINTSILNSLLYLTDQQIEKIILATSIIFDKHQRLINQDDIDNNIKMLEDIVSGRLIYCNQRIDSNISAIIIGEDNQIKIISSPKNSEDISDETYKDFFQRHLNDLLETNYDFSQANITKKNSQSFLKLTLLYSKSEIEDNPQFKNNLKKFLEIIATKNNRIGVRNDQKTDSEKALDAINGCALVNSQNLQETSKPKFQISISSLANSANLSSADFSQNHSQNQSQTGAGVFAMRAERNLRLNEIPQLPENFNQSPNYAHQSFLAEVLGDDNYAQDFANQTSQNMDAILHHLFFNPQNQELGDLLGDQKYSELQNKISQSPLLCVPPAPGSSENTASFQFENTYGNQGEINVGAVLDKQTLSLGIFNGVNLKLGLRINPDGSKEEGLFDDQKNLLINSASVIEMYEKSGMNSDSLVSTIARFGSLNSNGNGQASYIESQSTTYSLKLLNGIWYLGVFQSNEDQKGQNILEFRGAIKINDLSKIIAIPKNKKVSEIASDPSMKTITIPNQWVNFPSNDSLSQSSSLTNSVESSKRTSLESETARLLPDSSKLKSDNEDDQTARCCCGLFSRVNIRNLGRRFSDLKEDTIKSLGKIKSFKVINLKNLARSLSGFNRHR